MVGAQGAVVHAVLQVRGTYLPDGRENAHELLGQLRVDRVCFANASLRARDQHIDFFDGQR